MSRPAPQPVRRCVRLLAGAALLATALASPLAHGAAPLPSELRLGLAPTLSRDVLAERFQSFSDYLAEHLQVPVHLQVARSYSALVDDIVAGALDLAILPPLEYVLARESRSDVQLLAIQVFAGSTHYTGCLAARAGSAFTDPRRLGGARLAFVDPTSASGFLFPIRFFRSQRLSFPEGFGPHTFAGSHVAAIQEVTAGRADVAAVYVRALREATSEGVDVTGLRIVAKTGRIPSDALCARPGLAPSLVERTRVLALAWQIEERSDERALLHGAAQYGWAPVEDAAYDVVREALRDVREALPTLAPPLPRVEGGAP